MYRLPHLQQVPVLDVSVTTAPSALANQQMSLLGRTSFTRPSQDSVAAFLSIVRPLIPSSDHRISGRQAEYIPIVLVHQLQCYSLLLQGPFFSRLES